jgi:hypothetical protein
MFKLWHFVGPASIATTKSNCQTQDMSLAVSATAAGSNFFTFATTSNHNFPLAAITMMSGEGDEKTGN